MKSLRERHTVSCRLKEKKKKNCIRIVCVLKTVLENLSVEVFIRVLDLKENACEKVCRLFIFGGNESTSCLFAAIMFLSRTL